MGDNDSPPVWRFCRALGPDRGAPLWNAGAVDTGKLATYHVHGFVPSGEAPGSHPGEIVFTEEQYHKELHNPYSWASLVELRVFLQKPSTEPIPAEAVEETDDNARAYLRPS